MLQHGRADGLGQAGINLADRYIAALRRSAKRPVWRSSPGRLREPVSTEALPVQTALKEAGSFVPNIREKALKGGQHTHVLNLILALREQG